ncbi:heterokaryon incompatibility protein-domain-containing protein [Daldinia bambusicola]|nr:heterokaryon incompatibility protein-domain-containing protein [Daldinia bambusicola]
METTRTPNHSSLEIRTVTLTDAQQQFPPNALKQPQLEVQRRESREIRERLSLESLNEPELEVQTIELTGICEQLPLEFSNEPQQEAQTKVSTEALEIALDGLNQLQLEAQARELTETREITSGTSNKDKLHTGMELNEAIDMYAFDEFGLFRVSFAKILPHLSRYSEGKGSLGIENEPPEEFSKNLEEISQSHQYSGAALIEIITSTVYEILNVFHIPVTREQVPGVADISMQIRILHILPGSGGSPIECLLEVRDLSTEGIDEALSYVCGKSQALKSINVDGRRFEVTDNLFTIIVSLRDQHIKRSIWIDAICINQSDSDEKVHQVRLMRDIYTGAKKTTIWLSGRTLEEQPANSPQVAIPNDPADILSIPHKTSWGIQLINMTLSESSRGSRK